MFYLFTQIDLLEFLFTYSQKHENLELDEIIPLFISLSFSLTIFAIRRTVELNRLLTKTTFLSMRDHLTKLYNRRYIQDSYVREIQRSIRKGKALSVLMIDIDDFKKVNDTYGHNIGDEVLKNISNIMLTIARQSDIVGRWGGEEFLIICPETDLKEATTIASRLIKTIDESVFKAVGNVTISIGAVNTFSNERLESVVSRADKCLYKAKKNGKNRYIVI